MTVDDAAMIATSFPEFRPLMEGLGASFAEPRDVRPMIIAIDGPAASGKGTLAKRIAEHFGLPYLDTGLLYRAVARDVRARGRRPGRCRRRRGSGAHASIPRRLDDPNLRGYGIGEAASIVGAHPRRCGPRCCEFQQRFCRRSPAGAVLDGRDIGTVVCPDADVKIFVTASPEVRAERRYLETQSRAASPRPTRPCWTTSAAGTSAMPARGGPHAAGRRRLLAGYQQFGYRSRIQYRRRRDLEEGWPTRAHLKGAPQSKLAKPPLAAIKISWARAWPGPYAVRVRATDWQPCPQHEQKD